MRELLRYLNEKTEQYAQQPLFEFLGNPAIDVRERLAFVPGLAHFVMTFADLYALVLREEPAADRFQELVNAHTYEDGDHWKWYLADLASLGYDSQTTLGQALRVVWSDSTLRIRQLSYQICQLGLHADSFTKLILVQCIEAAGAVSLRHAAPVGREMGARLGRNLVYFGPHHFETESTHTLEQGRVHEWLSGIELTEETRTDAKQVVDRVFSAFVDFADEVLQFAKKHAGKVEPSQKQTPRAQSA